MLGITRAGYNYGAFALDMLEQGLHVQGVHATLCKPGAVAQLGARLNGIQKVKGSNPFSSTKRNPCRWQGFFISTFFAICPLVAAWWQKLFRQCFSGSRQCLFFLGWLGFDFDGFCGQVWFRSVECLRVEGRVTMLGFDGAHVNLQGETHVAVSEAFGNHFDVHARLERVAGPGAAQVIHANCTLSQSVGCRAVNTGFWPETWPPGSVRMPPKLCSALDTDWMRCRLLSQTSSRKHAPH